MIKNFKMFDGLQTDGWIDKYILCVPSGEVLFIGDVDIEPLIKIGYVYYDFLVSGNRKTPGYMCNDFMSSKVRKYMDDNSKSKKDNDIKMFLKECGLLEEDQYLIKEDKSVDAYGPVNMSFMKLKRIPIKFNRCLSDFICSHNNLETLENCPNTVHGIFDCSYNRLTNLIGGPKMVSMAYKCNDNYLNSLSGSPLKLKAFNCSYNFLMNLNDAPIVSGAFIKNNNLFNDN